MKTSDSSSSRDILKYFIRQTVALRYLYLICFLLFGILAVIFNKYSTKVYEVSATVGPFQNSTTSLVSSDNLNRSSEEFQIRESIENEMTQLKSFSLINNTIKELQMDIGYFRVNNKLIKETSKIFRNKPFTVKLEKSHSQPINTKFWITIINDSTFRIKALEKHVTYYNYIDNQVISEDNDFEIDTICKFNQTITNSHLKFIVSLNKEYFDAPDSEKDKYYFIFYMPESLTYDYLDHIKVDLVSIKGTIIQLQVRGQNLQEIIGFLNKYLESYLNANLNKKNTVALSTVKFIDSQISEIADSLVSSESSLRNYRSANQVMDISYQGQKTYDQMSQIETERSNLQNQQRYYNYILNYFDKNKDVSALIPPSAMSVDDRIMNQLITDLLALNTDRSGIISNSNTKNIFLSQIDNKIQVQKRTIIEYVKNNLNTLNLSLIDLNYRADKLSKEISKLPKTELNLIGMQRKFKFNDDMYKFLLQKRSEAAITMASNHPDYEIIEPAREITSLVVRPRSMLNILGALFLALMLPTLYIVGKDYFNDKIESVTDLEYLVNKSVIGTIYTNNSPEEFIILKDPNGPVAESFRNLRASLFHKHKEKTAKFILITSSQPGEGKSFVSLNLAASIAAVGYKTVLLDCDFRRPSLHSKFGIENSTGISNYVVYNTPIQDLLIETSVKNLSFIPGGPLLPNPSELIESGVFNGFFQYLSSSFDFIIIDSTPIGFFADPLLLIKYATETLLVTRFNFSSKEVFLNAVNLLTVNQSGNFEIIVNDINFEKSAYKAYASVYLNKKKT